MNTAPDGHNYSTVAQYRVLMAPVNLSVVQWRHPVHHITSNGTPIVSLVTHQTGLLVEKLMANWGFIDKASFVYALEKALDETRKDSSSVVDVRSHVSSIMDSVAEHRIAVKIREHQSKLPDNLP